MQSSNRIAAVFENLLAHTERFELLLTEVNRTLAVGGETALRVNEAARALNVLFETEDEEPDDVPFDIAEYGSAASEIAAARLIFTSILSPSYDCLGKFASY